MVLVDMDAGLLFFFAMGASTELSVFMAGWSSRNKYSLLGAMRAVAQMISYEVVLLLSSVVVVMMAGSLSLTKIVEAQNHYTWGLPHWYIFTPWGLAGFVMYAIAATAETNRSPFDLPEGESELVAGYHTEYSGFKFALFFLGEYLAMFSISGLGTTLFLGGWSAPFSFLTWVPSWIWFFSKLMLSIFVFIWMRGTLPRLRQDQLMNFAWKFVLPMCAAQSDGGRAVALYGRWLAALGGLLGDSARGLCGRRPDGACEGNTLGRGVIAMRSKCFQRGRGVEACR